MNCGCQCCFASQEAVAIRGMAIPNNVQGMLVSFLGHGETRVQRREARDMQRADAEALARRLHSQEMARRLQVYIDERQRAIDEQGDELVLDAYVLYVLRRIQRSQV